MLGQFLEIETIDPRAGLVSVPPVVLAGPGLIPVPWRMAGTGAVRRFTRLHDHAAQLPSLRDLPRRSWPAYWHALTALTTGQRASDIQRGLSGVFSST